MRILLAIYIAFWVLMLPGSLGANGANMRVAPSGKTEIKKVSGTISKAEMRL